jgi:pyruvate dehydrogenase E1 component alpha subunit
MDVLAVMQAVRYAKEHTTSGKGPLLLEMVTYRYGGHSMSDPGTTYRTREEIQHMRSSNDPITGLKNQLLEWDVISEAELKKIDKDARAEVEEAVKEAKASPEPSQDVDMWCVSTFISFPSSLSFQVLFPL